MQEINRLMLRFTDLVDELRLRVELALIAKRKQRNGGGTA